MKADKDQPKKVSTCFEETPCAEMMQKIMDGQGIGSLCERLMRSMTDEPGEGRGTRTRRTVKRSRRSRVKTQ